MHERNVHLPALAMACAVALALTIGMPLAMERHAATQDAAVSLPHTDSDVAAASAPAVAMAPGTIHVEVLGQRPVRHGWAEVVQRITGSHRA